MSKHRQRMRDTAPEMREALQTSVDAWHAKDSNFERELKHGTPEWLKKARTLLAKINSA